MLMGNRFFAAMVALVLLATAIVYFIFRPQSVSDRPAPFPVPAQGASAQPLAMAVPDEG